MFKLGPWSIRFIIPPLCVELTFLRVIISLREIFVFPFIIGAGSLSNNFIALVKFVCWRIGILSSGDLDKNFLKMIICFFTVALLQFSSLLLLSLFPEIWTFSFCTGLTESRVIEGLLKHSACLEGEFVSFWFVNDAPCGVVIFDPFLCGDRNDFNDLRFTCWFVPEAVSLLLDSLVELALWSLPRSCFLINFLRNN